MPWPYQLRLSIGHFINCVTKPTRLVHYSTKWQQHFQDLSQKTRCTTFIWRVLKSDSLQKLQKMYNSNLGQPKEEKERKQMTEQERSLLNKLLPRIFKLKLIHIPQSNEHEVIVEPYRSVLGFKTNCYKPNQKIIGPHMAQEEFDRVVFQGNSE